MPSNDPTTEDDVEFHPPSDSVTFEAVNPQAHKEAKLKGLLYLWQQKVKYATYMAHVLQDAWNKKSPRQIQKIFHDRHPIARLFLGGDMFSKEIRTLHSIGRKASDFKGRGLLVLKNQKLLEDHLAKHMGVNTIRDPKRREQALEELRAARLHHENQAESFERVSAASDLTFTDITDELEAVVGLQRKIIRNLENPRTNWREFIPNILAWLSLMVLESAMVLKLQTYEGSLKEQFSKLDKARVTGTKLYTFFSKINEQCAPSEEKNFKFFAESGHKEHINPHAKEVMKLVNSFLAQYDKQTKPYEYWKLVLTPLNEVISDMRSQHMRIAEQIREEERATERRAHTAMYNPTEGNLDAYYARKLENKPSEFTDFLYFKKGGSINRVPLSGTIQVWHFAVVFANVMYYLYNKTYDQYGQTHQVSQRAKLFESDALQHEAESFFKQFDGKSITDGENTFVIESIKKLTDEKTGLYYQLKFEGARNGQPNAIVISPMHTASPLGGKWSFRLAADKITRAKLINKVQNQWFIYFNQPSHFRFFRES